MSIYLKKSVLFRSSKTSLFGFNITDFIKDILIEQSILIDPECCSGGKDLYIKNGFIGKGTTNLKTEILKILVDIGNISNFTNCCDIKYNIPSIAFLNKKTIDTISLKNEIKRILDLNSASYIDNCCPNYIEIPMQTFLNNNTLGYPVGVFNVSGDYIGVADDQQDYIEMWNSDSANQANGTLKAGSNKLLFKIPDTSSITEVIGLRYYEYTGPANMEIFIGDNDIVQYGTTIKEGDIDGTNIVTTTRQEWNRNLFSGGGQNDSTIPADDVRVLVCTGYLNQELLRVFHNEDSEYAGVSQTTGYYTIGGNYPTALKATYYRGRFITNYNNILNWDELTQFFSWYTNSSGGTPWGFNPIYFPANLFGSTVLKQVGVGQDNFSPASILADYPYLNSTNFPALEDLVIHLNTGDGLTAAVSWFLTMPKVTNLFYYQTQTATQSSAAVADGIWNNVAIALSGVVPTGAAKKLRIIRTNNVTAASLASRNALISAGWTVLTN